MSLPRLLSSLSVEEVGVLMDSLSLSAHKEELFEAGVDGSVLAEVWSVEDLSDLGLSLPVSAASRLKGKVEELRVSGVEPSLLVSPRPAEKVCVSEGERVIC